MSNAIFRAVSAALLMAGACFAFIVALYFVLTTVFGLDPDDSRVLISPAILLAGVPVFIAGYFTYKREAHQKSESPVRITKPGVSVWVLLFAALDIGLLCLGVRLLTQSNFYAATLLLVITLATGLATFRLAKGTGKPEDP